DEEHVPRHAAREQREEFAVEIRRRMMLAIGAPVALHEEIPVGLLRFRTAEATQHDSRFGDAASLLADLLALVVGERGEEILEVAIAGIAPVEMHDGAFEAAAVAQRCLIFLLRGYHVSLGALTV